MCTEAEAGKDVDDAAETKFLVVDMGVIGHRCTTGVTLIGSLSLLPLRCARKRAPSYTSLGVLGELAMAMALALVLAFPRARVLVVLRAFANRVCRWCKCSL